MTGLPVARFKQYEVTAELGRGGMGTVYAALDRARGEVVALKCLSLERLVEPRDRARYTALFEREYYALSQLDHPHIIRAYDFGLDEVGPYYTMELLKGESLRTHAPWPWPTACSLLRDITSALSHLHARSLVHRDVTPLNIYCTPDGRAKLIDFGAMMPAGVPKQIVGTPAFIAPECLDGQSVDARTDLFALGACLYYALTGQHAYPARTLMEVRQMWQTPPHAVSSLASDVPPALEELVYSLLHLQPENRPRTAADVYERLSVIAGLPRDEGDAEAAAYLSKPKLVGRERQERSLRRRAQQAAAGSGGALVLQAQPGLGRTRMLDAAARQAQLSGLRIARADASAGVLGSFAVIKRLMEGLAADAPELSQTLRELGLAEPQPNVTGSAGPESREHRIGELVRALHNTCKSAPCALLVDDVHAIDEPSLACLAELSMRASELGLLIVSTCAPVQESTSSAALSLLLRASRPLEISPLTAEETRELVVSLVGEVPNVDLFASLLQQHAKGVPLPLMQAAEACLAQGLLRYEAGNFFIATAKDALARVIAEHARPQLEARPVSAEARALLQVIAFDRFEQLEVSDYQRVLGTAEAAPVYRALIELRDARRVEWLEERARLAHEGERQALVAELSDARRELHLILAAQSEERQLQGNFAAYHYGHAGDFVRCAAAHDAFDSYVNDHPEDDALRHPITLEAIEFASRMPDFAGAHPAFRAKYSAATVLNAGYVGQMELAAERMPGATRELTRWSGVADYAELADLPADQRLVQAFTRATERCNQPGVGALDVVAALRRQTQLSIEAAVIANCVLDASLLSVIPDLEPFRVLSPALALAGRTVEGLSLNVRGQLWAAWDSLRQTHLALCEQNAQLDSMTRMALHRTVLPYLAALSAELGANDALGLIAQCAEFMPDLAESQRSRYHMARGDLAGAAAAHRRYELLSLRTGTFSEARIVELSAHLTMFALCQDGVGLSRTLKALREVADKRPGFAARVKLATALWQQSQGQYAEALATVTHALAEHAPPHADWQLTAALHVELLSALGRSAGAAALGREYRESARKTQQPTYRILFATADACMRAGLFVEAEQAFNEGMAELEQRGVTGVLVGCGYELGARIALAVDDRALFKERAARCLSHFELGDHPALRARYNTLMRDASRSGVQGQTAARYTLDSGALRARLERLIAHATQYGEDADYHRGLLDVLIEQAAAVGGVLYRRSGGAVVRVAAVGALSARAGLDALVQGVTAPADEDRTVMSEALTERATSIDLELYTLTRAGGADAFVAALEVGLLERKRIDPAVLQVMSASLAARTLSSVDGTVSGELTLSGVQPAAAARMKEDTEDLLG